MKKMPFQIGKAFFFDLNTSPAKLCSMPFQQRGNLFPRYYPPNIIIPKIPTFAATFNNEKFQK